MQSCQQLLTLGNPEAEGFEPSQDTYGFKTAVQCDQSMVHLLKLKNAKTTSAWGCEGAFTGQPKVETKSIHLPEHLCWFNIDIVMDIFDSVRTLEAYQRNISRFCSKTLPR